jgi:sugar phosphate isomerase/epimerase
MYELPTRREFLCSVAAAAASACRLNHATSAAETASGQATPPLRMAICNETFGETPFDQVVATVADCGYEGLEIAPFTLAEDVRDIPDSRRTQLRRQAERSEVTIVGLHWLLARTKGLHLTSPDADTRRRTTAYLGDLARLCADLGGRLLIFGSPKQRNLLPDVSREAALTHAIDVVQRVLPVLERLDVTLAMEPLSPRTTNFLTTAAEAAELVERVASPRCRLILDCLAMSTEPTPIPDLIRRHAPLLSHFHANDPNRRGPGFGELDFVPILRALREVRYAGWISVEVFDYSPGAERLARESIDYLRKCDPRATAAGSPVVGDR